MFGIIPASVARKYEIVRCSPDSECEDQTDFSTKESRLCWRSSLSAVDLSCWPQARRDFDL